jgi:hypothetical protein
MREDFLFPNSHVNLIIVSNYPTTKEMKTQVESLAVLFEKY